MNKALRIFFMVFLLFVLSGCAGRDFVRPSSDAFILGKTTYSQIMQKMGEPRTVGDALRNGKNIKFVSYTYAEAGGEPLEEGVIPTRSMRFSFYNDILVSQGFSSSFRSDNSNFDDTKISAIVKGKTSRSEVIQLLGKPTSSLIYPMAKGSSSEAIGYGYFAARRGAPFTGLKLFSKSLIISFDNKNIVSDINYELSGTK